jgi:hypothetical protein
LFYNVRKTQNKPKKESKDVKTAEYHEIRAENQRLRKQNARLKKELEKRIYSLAQEEHLSLASTEPDPKSADNICPACLRPDLTEVDLGIKVLIVCKACKFKRKKE